MNHAGTKNTPNQNSVGIVMPAFNEAKVIGNILDSLPRTVNIGGRSFDIKIIVVNDGSIDSTADLVAKKPGVVLISHILNSGAGAATRTGLHYAKDMGCSYAITMDSDGQHSVKDAKRLLEAAVSDKADLIIGSRLQQRNGNMPTSKKIGNIGLSVITLILLGVYVSDTQSGLKVLNKRAMELIDFHSNNYAFSSEMIWKAHQAKLRIAEVPVEAIYTEYSKSRGQKNITGAMEITKQLVKRRLLSFINE